MGPKKRKSQPSKSLQNLKNHKLNSAIQQKQSKKASQKAKDQSSRDELNGVTADEELRLALNPQYSLEKPIVPAKVKDAELAKGGADLASSLKNLEMAM